LFPHCLFNSSSHSFSRFLYSSDRVLLFPAFYTHLPVFRWFPYSIFICPCPACSRIVYSSDRVPHSIYTHLPVFRWFPYSIFICPCGRVACLACSRILYSTIRFLLVLIFNSPSPAGSYIKQLESRLLLHFIFTSPSPECSRILYSSAQVPIVRAFYIHLCH
jgi:hypothetical protein